jgi:hypothetical protein
LSSCAAEGLAFRTIFRRTVPLPPNQIIVAKFISQT